MDEDAAQVGNARNAFLFVAELKQVLPPEEYARYHNLVLQMESGEIARDDWQSRIREVFGDREDLVSRFMDIAKYRMDDQPITLRSSIPNTSVVNTPPPIEKSEDCDTSLVKLKPTVDTRVPCTSVLKLNPTVDTCVPSTSFVKQKPTVDTWVPRTSVLKLNPNVDTCVPRSSVAKPQPSVNELEACVPHTSVVNPFPPVQINAYDPDTCVVNPKLIDASVPHTSAVNPRASAQLEAYVPEPFVVNPRLEARVLDTSVVNHTSSSQLNVCVTKDASVVKLSHKDHPYPQCFPENWEG